MKSELDLNEEERLELSRVGFTWQLWRELLSLKAP